MDVMVVGLVEAWWRVWRVVGGGRVVVGGLSCGSVALFCVKMFVMRRARRQDSQ